MPTYASFAPSDGAALPPASSSLLSTTPPAITKVLSQAYPIISAVDKTLGLVTWTEDDVYQSFLLLVGWCALVHWWDFFVLYFAHLGAAVVCILIVSARQRKVDEHPSLDTIVQRLSNCSRRFNLMLDPLTGLGLSRKDLTRFLFAALFMTPAYVFVTHLIFGTKGIVMVTGAVVLSWHSLWARVTRAILWRWKIVRLIVFYCTGVDFTRRATVQSAVAAAANSAVSPAEQSSGQVNFTYVLYENQRRWLGIGWTANMLSYERTPWTDEFLNEAPAPELFELPDSEGTGMRWKWVDETWRVDLSNDGALIPRSKVRFTPDPGEDDGYIYYDNMWRKPSAEPAYSKYTRRRRWVRTAELIAEQVVPSDALQKDENGDENEDEVDEVDIVVESVEGSTATESPSSDIRRRAA